MTAADKQLYLRFHGRILDSLGIQMYQSPTAALAELVANAWDADCEEADITLPSSLDNAAVIEMKDDGLGMTFAECQDRYLKVGSNRRAENGTDKSPTKGRPVLGRKGIGKFAGFGIARVIEIRTTSKSNGETTVFEMDLDVLKGTEFVSNEDKVITLKDYVPPNEADKAHHGTTITLKHLNIKRLISETQMLRSMARRFLLHQGAADFSVKINETPLPGSEEDLKAEFVFPNAYAAHEIPAGLTIESDGWGSETVGGNLIRWRFVFSELPIEHEELRGVSVFCRGKVAQAPFIFNLSGGLGGQHGLEYLSGQVQADFIDEGSGDPITTERQRINWELPETGELLEWGQTRLKQLLRLWKEKRGEKRYAELGQKMAGPISTKLAQMPSYERKVLEATIRKVASIPTLSQERFEDLSSSFITAWEGGRLRDLIVALADTETMDATNLLEALVDAKALTALQTAEAVKTKLAIIDGLSQRIENRELENSIRDYVAVNPWLISNKWETYRREISVGNLITDALKISGIDKDEDWTKRIDLVMSSGDHLLILEFMRPGLTIDNSHLTRFEDYVSAIRNALQANTALPFKRVTGVLVADALDRKPVVMDRIRRLEKEDMLTSDWKNLLAQAEAQWKDFMHILSERAPDEERIKQLIPIEEPKLLEKKDAA